MHVVIVGTHADVVADTCSEEEMQRMQDWSRLFVRVVSLQMDDLIPC